MGSQSETLAIYIKITYLNKELWNIFQYRPQWASATVSACLSLEKYFCSFSNKISCVISESIPDPYFEDEEKRCFWRGKTIFLLLRSQRAKREGKKFLTDSVSGSPTTLYNKHQTEQHLIVDCGLWTADCGLRTVDNGFWSTPPWKNSSAHIVILKRFLKFAIAKMEMSNSSSLPLTPPCCEAWPPRLGNRGNPFWKWRECSSPFLREEIVRFGCSVFLTIGVWLMVVRKEIS